jgi:glycosyltransferase involved in cell wall biosynthesis
MSRITAHVIVRNDEAFVGYAIRSVIDYVDTVLVFDTGSTDGTVAVVRQIQEQHPEKVVLEEKGVADLARHTALRQEMLDRTVTEWFMILDGDEVWTRRAIGEASSLIEHGTNKDVLLAPLYACVGDLFHDYRRRGAARLLGRDERLSPRFVRLSPGLCWKGDYGHDVLVNANNKVIYNHDNSIVLSSGYWHLTHLERSSADRDVYSSGASRGDKRRRTHFLIGKPILEPLPEVFDDVLVAKYTMSGWTSFKNFLPFVWSRVRSLG